MACGLNLTCGGFPCIGEGGHMGGCYAVRAVSLGWRCRDLLAAATSKLLEEAEMLYEGHITE